MLPPSYNQFHLCLAFALITLLSRVDVVAEAGEEDEGGPLTEDEFIKAGLLVEMMPREEQLVRVHFFLRRQRLSCHPENPGNKVVAKFQNVKDLKWVDGF